MVETAAIFYKPEGYDTSNKRLLGRHSASEGFLKAFGRYHQAETIYCYSNTQAEFNHFGNFLKPFISPNQKINWIQSHNFQGLQQAGVLYKPDPVITDLAWQRRYLNSNSYSLCGVTHTVASKEIMASLGQLLIAPIEPWDAVICTSQAVKTIIENVLDNWSQYLNQRLNAQTKPKLNLPVIPLGIDSNFFPVGDTAKQTRQQLRAKLNIADNDIVVLFVGRLIFHAKAHPVPMHLALETAAQNTNTKIHLIQAGWFEDQEQELAFRNTSSLFSPSVNCIFLDGRQPSVRQTIWCVADIFMSLADNIQETFGLTPLEAMASELPVIVSDWNGYKESVRHEIDGFRIPTVFPPPPSTIDYAGYYFDDLWNYSTYIGHTSMATAVDINACTQALITLINNPELRQKMGKNGRQRVLQHYDWSIIIKSYEQLWQELVAIRNTQGSTTNITASQSLNPLCDDPCQVFAHYPTIVLNGDHVLALGSMASGEKLEQLRQFWMTKFGANQLIPMPLINQILEAIAQKGNLAVKEILAQYSNDSTRQKMLFNRTLVNLIKFDVLRIINL